MERARSSALVGRDEELERLETFLAGAAESLSRLLLEGGAGIGKTSIWAAGIERGRDLGFRVLQARPSAAERTLSFTTLGDLLEGLQDEVDRLAAPQRRALRIALWLEEHEGEPPQQSTIAVGLLELLRRLSRDEPLLLALDDIDCVDPPSAGVLEFACRRFDDARVCLLASARAGANPPLAFGPDERISIGPLSLDALDQLVHSRLGAHLPRPALRRLRDATSGNPFYALELVAELQRSGHRLEPGEPFPIPTHLREVVRARLATLSRAARDAVLAAAALAQPTVRAVGVAVGDGDGAIAEAVAADVLEVAGVAIRFSHPLFASTIYDDADPAEKKAMHKRLARVVTDPEERARQLAEAADRPDGTIAAFVEAAAESVVARGAPDAGLRLAQLAVDLTPADRRAALHKRRLACARYAFAAGDPRHAAVLLARQLEVAASGRERAEVELELGRAELATRGISTATEHFQRALQEAEGTDELELQATIVTELADMHLGDLRTDSDTSARAVSLAEKVWNPQLLARALALHGATLSASGHSPDERYWERAMRIEREAGDVRCGGPAYQYGIELFSRGEFETATTHLCRVADSMRARSDPMLPRVLLHLSDLRRASGSWKSAAEYSRQAHTVVVETGQESLEPECILYEARFAMLRGDLDRAADLTGEALVRLEELAAIEGRRAAFDGKIMEGFARSLRGRIASFSERHAEAHELFVEDLDSLRKLGLRELLVEVLVEDITTLVALGELDEAKRSLHELGELTAAHGKPWLDALEARARGIVASADGDLPMAFGYFERSRDLLDSLPSPWPYELARTLFWLGVNQRRARQKLAARDSLGRALEIFEGLGARLWAEKTRAELTQIGGRPISTNSLTPTERRVAEIVASGRSNAEAADALFMSPKTVEWNLSKIYKKLHLRSRAELAAKLARQPIHS